jgi:hypothetical protein
MRYLKCRAWSANPLKARQMPRLGVGERRLARISPLDAYKWYHLYLSHAPDAYKWYHLYLPSANSPPSTPIRGASTPRPRKASPS